MSIEVASKPRWFTNLADGVGCVHFVSPFRRPGWLAWVDNMACCSRRQGFREIILGFTRVGLRGSASVLLRGRRGRVGRWRGFLCVGCGFRRRSWRHILDAGAVAGYSEEGRSRWVCGARAAFSVLAFGVGFEEMVAAEAAPECRGLRRRSTECRCQVTTE